MTIMHSSQNVSRHVTLALGVWQRDMLRLSFFATEHCNAEREETTLLAS